MSCLFAWGVGGWGVRGGGGGRLGHVVEVPRVFSFLIALDLKGVFDFLIVEI